MHLMPRLSRLGRGRFVEVGTGQGGLSALLLGLGWIGSGYELNPESAAKARRRNGRFLARGRYRIVQGDWLAAPAEYPRADLVISSMVLEHLDEEAEARYVRKCRSCLAPGGRAVVFVPGSQRHWGVEDDIAGHYRRYSRARLRRVFRGGGFVAEEISGLTYPLSNLLLGLSNRLVARQEGYKQRMSRRERTESSGDRDVAFKTVFPSWLRVVLNRVTMMPWHVCQELCRDQRNCLVLYGQFRSGENCDESRAQQCE
jgi:SAM-dependent methyltransferase